MPPATRPRQKQQRGSPATHCSVGRRAQARRSQRRRLLSPGRSDRLGTSPSDDRARRPEQARAEHRPRRALLVRGGGDPGLDAGRCVSCGGANTNVKDAGCRRRDRQIGAVQEMAEPGGWPGGPPGRRAGGGRKPPRVAGGSRRRVQVTRRATHGADRPAASLARVGASADRYRGCHENSQISGVRRDRLGHLVGPTGVQPAEPVRGRNPLELESPAVASIGCIPHIAEHVLIPVVAVELADHVDAEPAGRRLADAGTLGVRRGDEVVRRLGDTRRQDGTPAIADDPGTFATGA